MTDLMIKHHALPLTLKGIIVSAKRVNHHNGPNPLKVTWNLKVENIRASQDDCENHPFIIWSKTLVCCLMKNHCQPEEELLSSSKS